MRSALRRARLAAEVAAIAAVMPPDPSAELEAAERERRRLNGARKDLATGTGRYQGTPIGHAMWELQQVEVNRRRLEQNLDRRDATRKDRRGWRAELGEWRQRHGAAAAGVDSLVGPERARLRSAEDKLDRRLDVLRERQQGRSAWDERHPEAALRIASLTTQIERLDAGLDRARAVGGRPVALEGPRAHHRPPPVVERGLGIDL